MSDKEDIFPIVIQNSPIEFALMGPASRHRGVLVKSKLATFDMIGYDNPYNDIFLDDHKVAHVSRIFFGPMSRIVFGRRQVHVVRAHTASVNSTNDRKSHFSFAWEGMCDERDLNQFQTIFSRAGVDLDIAIKAFNRLEIEYIISGLISSCYAMDRRARLSKYSALMTTLLTIALATSFVVLAGFFASRFEGLFTSNTFR